MRKRLITGGVGITGSNFVHRWLANHPDGHALNLDGMAFAGNLENLRDVEVNPSNRFIQGCGILHTSTGEVYGSLGECAPIFLRTPDPTSPAARIRLPRHRLST